MAEISRLLGAETYKPASLVPRLSSDLLGWFSALEAPPEVAETPGFGLASVSS
jgi:hypothetical protein